MDVLITGIHGFVGSNLVEYLKDSHNIYGLDIVFPKKSGVIKTFSYEELEMRVIPEVDVIIHLAGKAHDTKNKSEAEIYFTVNTELTKKVYDYFLNSRAKKFIFFSTAKAAADQADGVLTEDIVPNPVGPYGESKIMAEKYIMSRTDDRKLVYILRPCMIHGPGNKGNLNLLYKVVSRGIPWPLGAFDNKRTFTSIGNVCFVVNELISQNIKSGIFNIGDDEPLSTNELVELICQVLERNVHIWRLPKWLMKSIARIGGWINLPLNTDRLSKLTENYVSSNEKIKKALSVERFPVDARDGMIQTIKSFRYQ